MWRPNNPQWWSLALVAMLLVLLWPSSDDKSLAVKFVNWAVDPKGELPILPGPFDLGLGDDADAVSVHDMITQQYDELYAKGGWTRERLELKVMEEPFSPATERQVLAGIGVIAALVVWRLGGRAGK